MYIVQGPDGVPSDPVTKFQIEEWIKSGQLPPNAPIRSIDEMGFNPVQMHAEFLHLFQQSTKSTKGSKLIPTGNSSALISYYCGIASCFPLIGLPLAVFAFLMGIKGLKNFKENPNAYGKGHSITGIVLSSIGLILNLLIVFGLLAAILDSAK